MSDRVELAMCAVLGLASLALVLVSVELLLLVWHLVVR